MIIAYSKLGRSWNLDPKKASTVGGDLDCIRLLLRLSRAHPEHTFVLVGKNSGENPTRVGFPDNVVNPWYQGRSGRNDTPQYLHGHDGGAVVIEGWIPPKLDYARVHKSREAYEEYGASCRRLTYGPLAESRLVDGHIMWMGQHGGSNSPLPFVDADWGDGKMTNPQMAFVNYCSYLLDFINLSGIEPVSLCPDPRNYWKARELIKPMLRPVLAQYEMTKVVKHEQFGNRDFTGYPPGRMEGSCYVTEGKYEYAGLELTALDDPQTIMFDEKAPKFREFGIVSNENRKEVTCDRLSLVKEWVMKAFGDESRNVPIFGTWSEESQQALGRKIESVPTTKMYDTLRSFKYTVTFPASGSEWATAKPWECFAVGTVCFFHPKYDGQGHIVPARPVGAAKFDDDRDALSNWLRVDNPQHMKAKMHALNTDPDLYLGIIKAQRRLFEQAFVHWRGGSRRIEEVLNL